MNGMNGMIGYALCGSYCTFKKSIEAVKNLVNAGYDVLPIMSENAYSVNTRFGESKEIITQIEILCDRDIIHTIKDAEPLGPSVRLDALIVSPCTGNTLAKIAHGITDTAVTMAVKAHLRNDRPVIIAMASNDGLSNNLKNIGLLLERKNLYFVPFGQDDFVNKPHSLVADFYLINDTLEKALSGKQLQPLLVSYKIL